MPNENPLEDSFEPIDVEGFETEIDKTKIPPLKEGKYRFKVYDYALGKSRKSNNRYIKFKCEVVGDAEEDNNGKKCQTRILMIEGPGFGFFLDFASSVTPSRNWGKKATKLDLGYFESFNGCEFLADVELDYQVDSNGDFVLDDEGNKKPTGYNSMTTVYSIR